MELNCPLLEGCSDFFHPGAEASVTVPVWAAARGFWEHGPRAVGVLRAVGRGRDRAGLRRCPLAPECPLGSLAGQDVQDGLQEPLHAAVLTGRHCGYVFLSHDTLSKWEFFPFIPGKHCRNYYCQCISGGPWLRWFAQQKSIFQSF